MEALCLLMCAAGVGGATWCLAGGVPGRHASGWLRRTAQRQLRSLCLVMGGLPPARRLFASPAWQEVGDAVALLLERQGIEMDQDEACSLVLLASIVGCGLLAAASRSLLGAVVGVLAVAVAVPLWDSSRRRARQRALVDEMPEVFRTLAMALASGETLTQAIEYVGVHEQGHAGKAFARSALRLRCGSSTEEAMESLAAELDAPGVGLLTTALIISQRTGSPLRELFQSSARLVERQGELERLLAVKTAQVRLSVRIVCLLPAVIVGVLSLISVDFQHGLATPAGTASVLVAATMDGLALLAIRSIMRGVL